MKNSKSVLAVMYDFDKTLCTKNMQEYGFIPNVKMSINGFWREANRLAKEKKMDGVLAYMYMMLEKAHAAKQSIQRADFVKLGKILEFHPGVETWFTRLKQIGKDVGVTVEHYIISSGLHEIIEGSSIYKNFREVFACEFLYDENNVACWPKNVVNYTTKTQFLFRINKGILDISNDSDVNKYTPEDERAVPFRNMIYIGDGLTDVPCMKLVKLNGGYSIAVFQKRQKSKVEELLQHQRVDYLAYADYSENSELDKIVRDMVCTIAMNDSLQRKSKAQLRMISKGVKH
jgi:phosphoserine phosphatase